MADLDDAVKAYAAITGLAYLGTLRKDGSVWHGWRFDDDGSPRWISKVELAQLAEQATAEHQRSGVRELEVFGHSGSSFMLDINGEHAERRLVWHPTVLVDLSCGVGDG